MSDNIFSFNPANIGAACAPASGCGYNGIFSQFGTFPSWSPYQGTVVEQHITHSQNNYFRVNMYSGPWRFMAGEQGTAVSLSQWQGASLGQDLYSVQWG